MNYGDLVLKGSITHFVAGLLKRKSYALHCTLHINFKIVFVSPNPE